MKEILFCLAVAAAFFLSIAGLGILIGGGA